MGSIYKRGDVFWIKYYRNGKPYRESTKSEKESDAKRLLRKREGEISQGKIPGIYFEKIRYEELADDFLSDYKINQKRSLPRAERSLKHLDETFKGLKATGITTPRIRAYIEKRLEENAEHATINRELAALKRLLNLGAKQTPPKIDRVPFIPMLKENNVRKGFFEAPEFLSLRDALPRHLKGFATFAYKTGWRFSEISNLKWSQVDITQGVVRLEAGETKNDEGRTVFMDEELKAVFKEQSERRKSIEKITPYVFTSEKGNDRIKDFRKSWANACTEAKIGKRLFHDFRRTAVRNMIRAGIPEVIAMRISGHKTRSIFDRYNIVNEADLKIAAYRQETYLKSQMGTITGTVVDYDEKKVASTNANPL